MKVCKECGVAKPLDEFRDSTAGYAGGKYPRCAPCHDAWRKQYKSSWDKDKRRNANLMRLYGITLAQFNAMMVEQNHRCAICADSIDQSCHVDHDHKTGDVRGLLCKKCNMGIGMFNDQEALLLTAAAYLRSRRV